MSELAGGQQRIGRRLGLEPYYTVVKQSADGLRLESRPEANRPVGVSIMAVGAAMILVAAVVAVSGLISASSGTGFAVAALAAIVAGAVGGLGYQRAVGGYAVLTTRNSVVGDREAGTLTFTQGSRIGRERTQLLRVNQISGLRLRRRPLVVGLFRRVRPIVALELVVGSELWVLDSATDPEGLRPVAEAMAEFLGREFERE